MADPVLVAAAANIYTAAPAGGRYEVAVPAAVAVDDIGFMVVSADTGTVSAYTPDAGWQTLKASFSVGTLNSAVFWKRRTAGDPAVAGAVRAAGFSGNISVSWFRGAQDPTEVSATTNRSGTTFTVQAPTLTVGGRRVVLTIAADRTVAAAAGEQGQPTVSVGAVQVWHEGNMTLSAGVGICSTLVSAQTVTAAGTAPANTVTYKDSAANAWAFQVALAEAVVVPATPTGFPVNDGSKAPAALFYTTSTAGGPGSVAAPTDLAVMRRGFDSIAQVLAKPGFTMAHRGNSIHWPELSLHAFTQSVRRGYGILELSLARTSDGVWFGLHDDNINRSSGTTGLPVASSMTWAQVQGYSNILGQQGAPAPYMRLEEYIAAYGLTHVTMYDPKYATPAQRDELFAYLVANVGLDRAVYKGFGHSLAQPRQAKAYGMTTWGYFYQAGYDDGSLATYAPEWDILGMDYTANAAAWAAVTSYGKPVIGHIAPDQAGYDSAIAKGANGVQVSGTHVVRPVSWWT